MRALIALAFVLVASIASAQTPPQQLPLLQAADVTLVRSFTTPVYDGTGSTAQPHQLVYGGRALSVTPDGASLMYGCHDYGAAMAKISIPAGATATVQSPCLHVPNMEAVDGTDIGSRYLGGSIWWNNRFVVTSYPYYDADFDAVASHFAGPDLAGLMGPAHVGTLSTDPLINTNPGLVSGYMGVIPDVWRPLLGGPVLTGNCCIGNIGRSSYGPSVHAFDPDQIGVVHPVPATKLLMYPQAHPLGLWDGNNPLFNGSTKIVGVAFPSGTRSVLFIGRHGDNWCYGGAECNDPSDTSKGNHAFPYRYQIWAYDANHLTEVKAGTRASWDVQPYTTWTLTGIVLPAGHAFISGATYNDATRKLYVTLGQGGPGYSPPKIYEFAVALPTPPPTNQNCDGTFSGWVPVPPGEWSACESTPEGWRESRPEAQTFMTTTEPMGSGAACPTPASHPDEFLRVVSQACTPPPVTVQCSVVAVVVIAGEQVALSRCGPVLDGALVPIDTPWSATVPRPQ